MPSIELSKRGKLLILVPIYLLVLGFLMQNPYSAVIAAAIFSLFLYSRFYLYTTKGTISVDDSIEEGMKSVDEPFQIRQRLTSSHPLSMRVKPIYDDNMVVKGDEVQNIVTPATIKSTLVARRRGYSKVGGVEGYAYDPLGLYKTPLELKERSEILVHSSKDAIRRARAYAKRSHIEELIKDYHRYTTSSGELEEIRDYQPGDKLKDIHWKSVSKYLKYTTKVYEKMAMVDIHVLLDCGPSMRRSSMLEIDKMEHSIFVALEILKKFEISGHNIGMTAFDHKTVLFHHKPDHRHRSFNRIFDQVSELPSSVAGTGYDDHRYREDMDADYISQAEKEFSKRVGSIVSGSGTHDVAGIVEAVRRMRAGSDKKKLLVIISDLELNTGLTLKTVEKAKAMGNEVWVIVPFSPWYEAVIPDADMLERTYEDYERLEGILKKMHGAGAYVFELYPRKEGLRILLEKERGKR